MKSHQGDVSPKVKKRQYRSLRELTMEDNKSSDIPTANGGAEDFLPVENDSKQLVLYESAGSNSGRGALDLMESPATSLQSLLTSNSSRRPFASVGAFTVQCSACLKWRLIPTKEKYEEIRENILEEPFLCDQARAWRPDISCDDPTDISQDGSRLWAIDKPNIAQPPPGWERLLRIRGNGSTRFADIYYVTPSGERLRSMVEIEKYLKAHPEYIRDGVNLSKFSFMIPRPLQDNYYRKRPTCSMDTDSVGSELSRPLEPCQVDPIQWSAPLAQTEVQSHGLRPPSSHQESPVHRVPVVSVRYVRRKKPIDPFPEGAASSPCQSGAPFS